MMKALAIATMALSTFLFIACDEEESVCETISELCHDSTTPQGIVCHELGHNPNATEAQCEEIEDECRAECE